MSEDLKRHIETLESVLKQIKDPNATLTDRIMKAGTVTWLATRIECTLREELQ